MKTIAIMNLKGGIGKTITATSLAYIIGTVTDLRVLVIDADAQGNTSKLFRGYDPEDTGIHTLLDDQPDKKGLTASHIIKKTPYPSIDLIPANGYLMQTNANLLMSAEKNQIGILKSVFVHTSIGKKYDICICDCGLMLDMTALNILTAADMVIAPVKVGGFEVDALEEFAAQLEELKQINPKLNMTVLLTMRQKNRATTDMEEWLRCSSPYRVFNATIRRSIAVEKSTTAYMPLPEFSRKSVATTDYRHLAAELIERSYK